MPELACLGVDHHRTPVALRERLAVPAARLPEVVTALRALPGVDEAVVVSTCNRLEVYLAGDPTEDDALRALAAYGGLCGEELGGHARWHRGEAAVRHLFRVAGGLESLVLGEDQIVAQVRSAYDAAQALGATGSLLNPLFQRALMVAREVRATTAIGKLKMSVASVAVDLARQVHGDLRKARLLILGAGEMAELAVRYLRDNGVGEIGILNRSSERAMALADLAQATVWPWSELVPALAAHDIVVSSTAAPHLVVMADDVRAALARRHGAPLVLIDLAVPRDIDPQVAEVEDAYRFDLDDLDAVVANNRRLRADEIRPAETLINAQVTAFLADARPGRGATMAEVAAWFDHQVETEHARLSGRLGLADATKNGELRYGLERLANKLQHRLMAWARERGDAESEATLRELLGLDRSRREATVPSPPPPDGDHDQR
jgi:glutamyl-tRNA reductase